jgi:hypothetical protein
LNQLLDDSVPFRDTDAEQSPEPGSDMFHAADRQSHT